MQRMFINKKQRAKKRLANILKIATISSVALASILLVIIVIYGERTVSPAPDSVIAHIEDENDSTYSAENIPTQTLPSVDASEVFRDTLPFSIMSIFDDDEAEESEEPIEIQEDAVIADEASDELVQSVEPAEEQPLEIHESTGTQPAEPEATQPTQEEIQKVLDMETARQSCQAVFDAAERWWLSIHQTAELSEVMIMNSFISDFNLSGAYATEFDVTATDIKINGTYNNGNFIIGLAFLGDGKGIYFMAWYGSENSYAAIWHVGSDGIQTVIYDGNPLRP